MANDLTKFERTTSAPATGSAYDMPLMNPDTFNHMYRVGAVLASSPLFPDHLRKGDRQQAEANGMLVVNMALRLREDPLTVAQNIYFVGGKPGWNATYMISKANQHGVFADPIDWDISGNKDSLSVTAFAKMKGTGKRVEATADMEMARQEGWTRNTKYKSMPEQMLRYRAATMLIRLYCPEVMVGIPAAIEVETSNIRDVTPQQEAVPTAFDDTLPEAPTEAKRAKVDRTPPPAAQKEEAEGEEAEEEEAAPDPEATRIYGQNDGLHARRTKVQIEMDREIEDLAASLDIDVPTERPAVVVVEELRARAEAEATQDEAPEQAPQEDQTEGEPASEATGDPDAMMRAIDAAFTEDDLKMAAVGAGDLPEADRKRVREHYAKRLLQIREQTTDEEGSDDFQPDYGKLADLICRDLEQVRGDAVHEVLSTYETHLEDLEQKDTSAYQRVMNLAETRAGI